jgi:hypothetical protein
MKKYIFQVLVMLCGAVGFTACTDEEGTVPGHDANPVITIYQYEPAQPLNPDNDVILRFAANSTTEEAYYLAEKTSDKAAHVASMGTDGYADYVVVNGTKLEGIDGESNEDVTITDLLGEYTITVVAVNGSKHLAYETSFMGLEWEDVTTGVYYFRNKNLPYGGTTTETTLQKCTSDETLYRFKDLFGEGYSMKLYMMPDYTGEDESGTYTFFRVRATLTPYEYGSYGQISVRDYGYYKGNDSYVTSLGYESGMYEDGSCFLCLQAFVSAGSLGAAYDYFIAD